MGSSEIFNIQVQNSGKVEIVSIYRYRIVERQKLYLLIESVEVSLKDGPVQLQNEEEEGKAIGLTGHEQENVHKKRE